MGLACAIQYCCKLAYNSDIETSYEPSFEEVDMLTAKLSKLTRGNYIKRSLGYGEASYQRRPVCKLHCWYNGDICLQQWVFHRLENGSELPMPSLYFV
jgi:hypothetical protein